MVCVKQSFDIMLVVNTVREVIMDVAHVHVVVLVDVPVLKVSVLDDEVVTIVEQNVVIAVETTTTEDDVSVAYPAYVA